jgi:Autographiviridae RNA polymerase
LLPATDHDDPCDVYVEIVETTLSALKQDAALGNDKDRRYAIWWLGKLAELDNSQMRKLLKTPGMTFVYNATRYGMAEQIAEVYREKLRDVFEGLSPRDEYGRYLGKKIGEACAAVVPGPARLMRYIVSLADYCVKRDRFLRFDSPTGFPWINSYFHRDIRQFNLTDHLGNRVRQNIGMGMTDEIDVRATLNAAAPNLVHCLDSSHMIKTINAAAASGITDFLTAHDSFATHAPNVDRFAQIRLDELAKMYEENDVLAQLRSSAVGKTKMLPLPKRGELNLDDVRRAINAWT